MREDGRKELREGSTENEGRRKKERKRRKRRKEVR